MDFKKFNFTCPSCNELLSENEEVKLTTVRDNGGRGTVYLSAEFGNYTFRHLPETNFKEAEIVQFHCPFCETNLGAKDYENFALLKMTVGDGIHFDVIFSRKAGTRKTYVITEDGIETYGDNDK